ncbi:DUF455 family protein [Paenibacillus cymbidii]|uniref:DUF455 family protein n=1 Tax=Paenibacillus cymbidii TaxID=1639034 RepID=UPI0010808038|nr:DUF455 family protein [Paenibacillus cymbidii]
MTNDNLQAMAAADTDELAARLNGRDDSFLRPADTAAALRTMLWKEFELSRLAFGWMPAATTYERKTRLGRFGYQHASSAKELHERIKELPGSLNETKGTPEPIRDQYERMAIAPSDVAFLISYQFLLQRLRDDYDELTARLDPVLDAPTIDRIRRATLDFGDTEAWLRHELHTAHLNGGDARMLAAWRAHVVRAWNGGAPAEWPAAWGEAAGPLPAVSASDPRFRTAPPDAASALYADPANSPLIDSVKQMIYVNATEIIAAENLAYLYGSIHRMPLAFYYDLSRHLWDEVRHSQMGVRRLQQLGFDIGDFVFFPPIRLQPDSRVEQLIDGYVSLTNVAEACSFPYKRQAAQAFWKHGDPLSAIQSEFDIADERLHVDFGAQWGPELYKQFHQEVITAQKLAEKAREFRLKRMNFSPEHIAETAKSFPAFCGVANTVHLAFENY